MILNNHIYVMRHGQSENNVLGIESCKFETQHSFGLTDFGKAQVLATAQSAPQFDFIYSSPFRRAQETAAIMAQYSEINVMTETLLQEFKLPSEYDLAPYEDAEVMIHDPFKNLNHTTVGDSETFDGLYERIKKVLIKIDASHDNSLILLVSHGSPIEACMQIVKGKNTGFGPFLDLPKNAQLIHLNTLTLIS